MCEQCFSEVSDLVSMKNGYTPPSCYFFYCPVIRVTGVCSPCVGAHGWVVPAMGALFNLGAGCQKGKPLDNPGIQPQLSNAVIVYIIIQVKPKCINLSF